MELRRIQLLLMLLRWLVMLWWRVEEVPRRHQQLRWLLYERRVDLHSWKLMLLLSIRS